MTVLSGCSLIVGNGTRVLASGDAGEVVEAGADAAADASVDSVDAPMDARHDALDDTGLPAPADSGMRPPADARADSACSPLCSDASGCASNKDCASQQCHNGICEPPGCASGPNKCNDGSPCGSDADCASQACVAGQCAAPSCSPSCGQGSACGDNSDCGPPHMCMNGSCK